MSDSGQNDFFNFKLINVPAEVDIKEMFQGLPAGSTLVFFDKEATGEKDLSFIKKVMQAVALEPGKNAYLIGVDTTKKIPSFDYLTAPMIQFILVFGILPTTLGLQLKAPVYLPFTFGNKTFIFTEDLSNLQQDKEKKGLLWKALQAAYKV